MPTEGLRSRRSWRDALDVSATLMVVVLAVVVSWKLVFQPSPREPVRRVPAPGAAVPSQPLPSDPISITNAPTEGDPNAKAALVIFSDFQCPFCRKFATESLPQIRRKYVEKGKLLLVFRQFPLEQIHPMALPAAEAALCAAGRGQFWQLHDRLFAGPGVLDSATLTAAVEGLGLAGAAFDRCLEGDVRTVIGADQALGRSLGVSGTPTSFVGEIRSSNTVKLVSRIVGAQTAATVEAAIDQVLIGAK